MMSAADYRVDISALCKDAFYSARDNGRTMHEAADDAAVSILASEALARIIADAKAEVATAIESLHYDAPAARIAQATAARIARGGAL